jgi:predicted nucleic acid-binding protein
VHRSVQSQRVEGDLRRRLRQGCRGRDTRARPLLGLILDSGIIIAAKESGKRIRRRAFIDELKKHVPVHPVTGSTAEIAGQLSGEQAAKGITIPADNVLIGASAVEQGYALATLNTRHFDKIPGLQVLSSSPL